MRDPNAETITNAELIAEMRERRSPGPVTHDVCGACLGDGHNGDGEDCVECDCSGWIPRKPNMQSRTEPATSVAEGDR